MHWCYNQKSKLDAKVSLLLKLEMRIRFVKCCSKNISRARLLCAVFWQELASALTRLSTYFPPHQPSLHLIMRFSSDQVCFGLTINFNPSLSTPFGTFEWMCTASSWKVLGCTSLRSHDFPRTSRNILVMGDVKPDTSLLLAPYIKDVRCGAFSSRARRRWKSAGRGEAKNG